MHQLEIQLLDYWHCGSSRGAGMRADATCVRTAKGLPFIPGRQIKGLMRDAVSANSEEDAIELFGSETDAADDSQPGVLAVSNAQLSKGLREHLEGYSHSQRRAQLFSFIAQTAIGSDNGTALRGSLRRIEVALPMTLWAQLDELGDGTSGWPDILQSALPLIRSVGAFRSRGLGRCQMSLKAYNHG